MDIQRSLHRLHWTNDFPQQKSMDELRHSLILTMELEDTRIKVQEELKLRDQQIAQLKDLLDRVLKERDHAAMLEKLLLHQRIHQSGSGPNSGLSSIDDDPRRGLDGLSASDCDESIVSSPRQLPPAAAEIAVEPDRPLPEKGKLLQAVMKAGPLLQTLLLAGSLPQWQHPPPPLEMCQIPPPSVVPSGNEDPLQNMIGFSDCSRGLSRNNRKRGFCEGSDSSSMAMGLKYQRLNVLH